MKKIKLSAFLLLFCSSLMAQYGRLDKTFTSSGFTKFSTGKDDSAFQTTGTKAFVQSDGKIITLYESGGMTLLSRKNANGITDSSYRNKGFSTPVPITRAMGALLNNGKILVAGVRPNIFYPTEDIDYISVLYLFNTDGTLDNTFGGTGQLSVGNGWLFDLKQLPDGKVLVLGGRYEESIETQTFIISRFNGVNNIDLTITKTYSTQVQDVVYGINAVNAQSDGKIILAGNYLLRLNADGSDDASFGTNGKQALPAIPNSIAIQTDNKILTSYTQNFTVSRFLSNGLPDNNFGVNGTQSVSTSGVTYYGSKSLSLQTDGKMLITGYAQSGTSKNFAAVRYTSAGFPDNNFSGDGITTANFSANSFAQGLTMTGDGKLLLTGSVQVGLTKTTNPQPLYDAGLARYDASGNPDNTFSGDGKHIDHIKRTNTSFGATAVQTDGKVICAGTTWNGKNSDFILARYNADATLDNTFSGDGMLTTDFGGNDGVTSLAIQSDGKIVVAGGTDGNFAFARYNSNGTIDNTFGINGKVISDFGGLEAVQAMKVQTDGKIAACGLHIVARYLSNGTFDNSFNGNGRRVTDYFHGALDVQPDGKIVVGCNYDGAFYIMRFLQDGALDPTFGPSGLLEFYPFNDGGRADVNAIKVLPNGNIAAVTTLSDGSKGSTAGPSFYVVHILPYDIGNWWGALTQYPGLTEASSMVVQSDGKLIVGGEKLINGVKTFGLLRLNSDFTLDNTFGTGGVQYTPSVTTGISVVTSLAISGNKVYAAGYGQYPSGYGVLARYTLGNLPAAKTEMPITINDLKIKLSPNPVKDLLYVQLNTTAKVDKTVMEITGLDGKKWDQKIMSAAGKTNLPVDISKLPKGIYTITVYTNGSKSTSTFIKQ